MVRGAMSCAGGGGGRLLKAGWFDDKQNDDGAAVAVMSLHCGLLVLGGAGGGGGQAGAAPLHAAVRVTIPPATSSPTSLPSPLPHSGPSLSLAWPLPLPPPAPPCSLPPPLPPYHECNPSVPILPLPPPPKQNAQRPAGVCGVSDLVRLQPQPGGVPGHARAAAGRQLHHHRDVREGPPAPLALQQGLQAQLRGDIRAQVRRGAGGRAWGSGGGGRYQPKFNRTHGKRARRRTWGAGL